MNQLTHHQMIGRIPLQMSSGYLRVNDTIVAYENLIHMQKNKQTSILKMLSPRQIAIGGHFEAFNWKVHHTDSIMKVYPLGHFQRIYEFNTLLMSDLFKTNGKDNILKQYRTIDTYFTEDNRVNLLLNSDDLDKFIDFKNQVYPYEQSNDLQTLYTNVNNPYVTYAVYDIINTDARAIEFFNKLVNHKAFTDIEQCLAYYGAELQDVETISVFELFKNYKFQWDRGTIDGYRNKYKDNTAPIAFIAYSKHIKQFHPTTLTRMHHCDQCNTTTPCSAIRPDTILMQPQLLPITQLQVYPLPLTYYDSLCQIYQTLICQFKIWCNQDSIGQLLGMPISSEPITTSLCNAECNYENLELLGDSVLKYAVSQDLFSRYEDLDEGQLTQLRTKMIRNTYLATLFEQSGMQNYILSMDLHFKLIKNQMLSKLIPCDDKPLELSQMADIYEAIAGYYFKQHGMPGFLKFLRRTNFPIGNTLIDYKPLEFRFATVVDYPPVPEFKYKFKNEGLWQAAINNYERLEFLGDACLELLVVAKLYEQHHKLSPGTLTTLKGQLLNNNFMGWAACRMQLVDGPTCEGSDIPDLPKRYGDVFESVAGAVLLDGGWDALNQVYGNVYEQFINYYICRM